MTAPKAISFTFFFALCALVGAQGMDGLLQRASCSDSTLQEISLLFMKRFQSLPVLRTLRLHTLYLLLPSLQVCQRFFSGVFCVLKCETARSMTLLCTLIFLRHSCYTADWVIAGLGWAFAAVFLIALIVWIGLELGLFIYRRFVREKKPKDDNIDI